MTTVSSIGHNPIMDLKLNHIALTSPGIVSDQKRSEIERWVQQFVISGLNRNPGFTILRPFRKGESQLDTYHSN